MAKAGVEDMPGDLTSKAQEASNKIIAEVNTFIANANKGIFNTSATSITNIDTFAEPFLTAVKDKHYIVRQDAAITALMSTMQSISGTCNKMLESINNTLTAVNNKGQYRGSSAINSVSKKFSSVFMTIISELEKIATKTISVGGGTTVAEPTQASNTNPPNNTQAQPAGPPGNIKPPDAPAATAA